MLQIAQIVVSVILIVLVPVQERSTGMSGLFGGGGPSSSYQTRRGLERVIYWATIGVGIIFAILAILNLVLKA